MMFVPFLMPMSGGYGVPHGPRTDGRRLLAVIGTLVTIVISIAGYAYAGVLGLLLVPGVVLLLCWEFLWGWLAVEALNHGTSSKGIAAGIYFMAYALSVAVAFASIVISAGAVFFR